MKLPYPIDAQILIGYISLLCNISLFHYEYIVHLMPDNRWNINVKNILPSDGVTID